MALTKNNGNGHGRVLPTGNPRITVTTSREDDTFAPTANAGDGRKDIIVINSLDDLNRLHRDQNVQMKQDRLTQIQQVWKMTSNLGATELIRTNFLKFLLDGQRDIDADCGYPAWLTPDHYRVMYDREGIAKRVVDCEPEETWAMDPEVYEDEDAGTDTDFEHAWAEIVRQHNIWHYLSRIDVLSGIGQFGILLLGIDDGRDLHEPVEGVNDDGSSGKKQLDHKLLFMRPFDESVVFVKLRETDTTSPRYGQPVMYTIHFRDFPNWGIQAGEVVARDVHWSRCIHVADNRKMSEIYGVPRMQPVWNRLYDLRKIYSSSGEGYWKGAFPGLAFEINPEIADQGLVLDEDSLRKQFEAYSNGLQRYMAVTGVTTKTLPPQMIDPTGTAECHLKSIAISKGIPYRVLFGSEEAKLASGQDAKAWNKRLAKRQTKYVSPLLIRPFVNRLITLGVLPRPKDFHIDWPDLNAPTDLDKAQVGLAVTQAIGQYVSTGANQLVPPDSWLTMVMKFSDKEKDTILEQAAEQNGQDQPDDESHDDADGNQDATEQSDDARNEGKLSGFRQAQGNALEQKDLSGRTTQGGGTRVDSQLVYMPGLNKAVVMSTPIANMLRAQGMKLDQVSFVNNVVVKKGGSFYVMTEDRSKRLGGPYKARSDADQRLAEIEYFKHKTDNAENSDKNQKPEFAGECPSCGADITTGDNGQCPQCGKQAHPPFVAVNHDVSDQPRDASGKWTYGYGYTKNGQVFWKSSNVKHHDDTTHYDLFGEHSMDSDTHFIYSRKESKVMWDDRPRRDEVDLVESKLSRLKLPFKGHLNRWSEEPMNIGSYVEPSEAEPEHEYVTNDSEDESRDDHGRWTAGSSALGQAAEGASTKAQHVAASKYHTGLALSHVAHDEIPASKAHADAAKAHADAASTDVAAHDAADKTGRAQIASKSAHVAGMRLHHDANAATEQANKNEAKLAMDRMKEAASQASAHTSPMRKYLAMVGGMAQKRDGYEYANLHDLVDKAGVDMPVGPLPKGVTRGQMKMCYMNTYHLVESNPKRYVYCEGYAMHKGVGIPVNHAWALDTKDGKVVDPTWEKGEEYRGIPLKMSYVRKTILAKKTYGVVDNMEHGFPLVTGKHKLADVIDRRGASDLIHNAEHDVSDEPRDDSGKWTDGGGGGGAATKTKPGKRGGTIEVADPDAKVKSDDAADGKTAEEKAKAEKKAKEHAAEVEARVRSHYMAADQQYTKAHNLMRQGGSRDEVNAAQEMADAHMKIAKDIEEAETSVYKSNQQELSPRVVKTLTGMKEYDGGLSGTMADYKDPNTGKWKPERVALHDEIVEGILGNAKPSQHPTVVMMGGGTAAGKSSMINSGQVNIMGMPKVDSDDIKSKIPEYVHMLRGKDKDAAAYVHEESSHVAKRAMAQGLDKSLNMMMDGTGDSSLASLQKKVESWRKNGAHRIVAEYATCPVENALARAEERGRKSGRFIRPALIRAIHSSVSRVVPEALKANLFDECRVWDTDVPKGAPAIKIAEQKNGKLVIFDKNRWQAFVDKGKEPDRIPGT